VFAVSTIPPLLRALLRALCCRERAKWDFSVLPRVFLVTLTVFGQIWCYFYADLSEGTGNKGLLSFLTIACAIFVVIVFIMDSNKNVEHSIPYAVTYSWALSASVLGASYILGMFYQYDTQVIAAVGASYSKYVGQISLTVFTSLILWVFSQVAGRITTARDRTVFMLPGYFAVVRCMNIHTHIHTQTHTASPPLLHTH
jgi:hypothetical protein